MPTWLTDLAIGSYLSGHAVILRTKPVVQFGYLMTSQNPSNTWKIAPHEKVDIKACFSYSSPDTNFESKLGTLQTLPIVDFYLNAYLNFRSLLRVLL